MDYEKFMEEVEQNGLVFFDYTFGSLGPCLGIGFHFNVSIGYLFKDDKYNFVYPIITNHNQDDTVEKVKLKIIDGLSNLDEANIKQNLLVLTDADENSDDFVGNGVENPEAVAQFIKENSDVLTTAVIHLEKVRNKFANDVKK